MSSSRILSSRPSASCITAKPIARTIKGRGRNASPFFLRRSRGFSSEPAGSADLWLSVPETAQSIAGRRGALALPITQPEAGKPNGFFHQRMPGALIYGSLSRKPYSPLLGHWRFCATQPEVGKPSRLFRQSLPGALLYGSLSRKPHSSLPGCCGAMDASALPRQEWNPCHKRKKRRKFPPLFSFTPGTTWCRRYARRHRPGRE